MVGHHGWSNLLHSGRAVGLKKIVGEPKRVEAPPLSPLLLDVGLALILANVATLIERPYPMPPFKDGEKFGLLCVGHVLRMSPSRNSMPHTNDDPTLGKLS